MKDWIKRKDVLLIAAALIAALALFGVSQLAPSADLTTVVATVNGVEVLRKPLLVNAEYAIPQEDGSVNIICVENGAVYMKEANCRDGLCVRQGKMKNRAKTIVCLPHEVVVQLDGGAAQQESLPPLDDIDIIIQ